MSCPCGSGKTYESCCGKYHQGTLPENALALMRSRYTAYALGLADYLIETTHPDYRHPSKDWRESILHSCQTTRFIRLEILAFEEKGTLAFVTFNAHLERESRPFLLNEKSRFKKVNGRWLYLDGTVKIVEN